MEPDSFDSERQAIREQLAAGKEDIRVEARSTLADVIHWGLDDQASAEEYPRTRIYVAMDAVVKMLNEMDDGSEVMLGDAAAIIEDWATTGGDKQ